MHEAMLNAEAAGPLQPAAADGSLFAQLVSAETALAAQAYQTGQSAASLPDGARAPQLLRGMLHPVHPQAAGAAHMLHHIGGILVFDDGTQDVERDDAEAGSMGSHYSTDSTSEGSQSSSKDESHRAGTGVVPHENAPCVE